MKQYTWSYDKNDELWQHDLFETKEECIADAKENYGFGYGEKIAIGEAVYFISQVDAEDVLERMEEQAFEECGEAAEGWITYRNDEIVSLSNLLTDVVMEWMKKTGNEPKFYHIQDIEEVLVN